MGFSENTPLFALDIVSDRVAPPFLQAPNGAAYLTAAGQSLDTIRYRSGQASLLAMPGKGDPSGDYYVGLDTLLLQGPNETGAHFEMRLARAYDDWQHAGSDWALLQQALSQVSPSTPAAFVVSNTDRWSWYTTGQNPWATPPYEYVSNAATWNWDSGHSPDGTPPSIGSPWWRVWLCVYSVAPNAWATQQSALGSGFPTLGNFGSGSLGFANVPPSFWTQLQYLLSVWKAGQAWVRWILVSFSSSLFSQDTLAGGSASNPNGTYAYGYIITNGQYGPAWNANVEPVPGYPPPPGGTIGPNIG